MFDIPEYSKMTADMLAREIANLNAQRDAIVAKLRAANNALRAIVYADDAASIVGGMTADQRKALQDALNASE